MKKKLLSMLVRGGRSQIELGLEKDFGGEKSLWTGLFDSYPLLILTRQEKCY